LKKIYIEIKRGGKMPQKLQTQPTQQIDSQAVREKLLSDERLFKLVVIYDRLTWKTWGLGHTENQAFIDKYVNELRINKDDLNLNNVKKEIEKEIRNFLKSDNLNDKQIENLTKSLTDNWQTRKLFITEKYLEYAKYQINKDAFNADDFFFNIMQIRSLLPGEINAKTIKNGQTVEQALKNLTFNTSTTKLTYIDPTKFNDVYNIIKDEIDLRLNFAFKEALKTDETTGGPGTTREPEAKRQGPTPQRTDGPKKTQKPPNPFLTEKFTAKEIVGYAIESGAGKVKESKNVSTTREMIYAYFHDEQGNLKTGEDIENMKEALILIFDFLGGPKAYAFIAKKAGEGKTAEQVLVEAVSDFKDKYGNKLNTQQKESLDNVLKPKETTEEQKTPENETNPKEAKKTQEREQIDPNDIRKVAYSPIQNAIKNQNQPKTETTTTTSKEEQKQTQTEEKTKSKEGTSPPQPTGTTQSTTTTPTNNQTKGGSSTTGQGTDKTSTPTGEQKQTPEEKTKPEGGTENNIEKGETQEKKQEPTNTVQRRWK
jgi:hypothetical protein